MATAIAIISFAIAAGLAIAAAIEDTRTHLLRNIYTVPIIGLALVGLTTSSVIDDKTIGATLTDMAIGAAWFAGPWLITHLIAPKQIGFGDIKLSAGLGLYLGWLHPSLGLLGFFAASLVFGVGALVSRSTARDPLPFGPALVAGAIIATVVGLL